MPPTQHLPGLASPYRDELETLRAENARLRRELAARRESRPLLALGLVALDVVAVLLVRPWLNGAADFPFWTSLGVVVGIAVAAAASAMGYKRA
jgi:hypothetical protein